MPATVATLALLAVAVDTGDAIRYAFDAAGVAVPILVLYRARGAVIETLKLDEHAATLGALVIRLLRQCRPAFRDLVDETYAEQIKLNTEMRRNYPLIQRELRAVRKLTRSFGTLLVDVTRAVDANTAATTRLETTCATLEQRDRERAEAHAELVGELRAIRGQGSAGVPGVPGAIAQAPQFVQGVALPAGAGYEVVRR